MSCFKGFILIIGTKQPCYANKKHKTNKERITLIRNCRIKAFFALQLLCLAYEFDQRIHFLFPLRN